VLVLIKDFERYDFNLIDMDAKKVLEALSEFNVGEFVKGEQIHKKTGLIPETINEAIIALEKSLLANNPTVSEKLPLHDFDAVEITDFVRQVLEKYG
jgi:hypothetical protein